LIAASIRTWPNISAIRTRNTRAYLTADSLIISSSRTILSHSDGVGKWHANAHKKSRQRRETIHKGWHAPALHELILGLFDMSRPRCYKSEGKAFAFSRTKINISPASSFANPDARTVEHCITRDTFDSFLRQISSLLDQHVLGAFFICVIILPSGMVCRLLEGNKLDARNGLFTQFSPSHTLVEGRFLIKSHTRGACQSLEVDCYLPALGLRTLLHFVKQYLISPQCPL
jgi:hypothetical protein